MDTQKIIADLHAERQRLDQAIAALESLGSTENLSVLGRRSAANVTAQPGNRSRGQMSPATRRLISARMKARWAERKAGSTPEHGAAPKQARGGPRRISAAGRKRIAEAARKMWAQRRKASAAKSPATAKKTVPAKTAAKKAPGTRHMSPAARKRISEAAKKRWAAKKSASKTA